MITIREMPWLHKAHCCQCEKEILGGEEYFMATLDPMLMRDGFEGQGQITCLDCVRKMLKDGPTRTEGKQMSMRATEAEG